MNADRIPHAVGAIILAVLALSLGDAIIKLTGWFALFLGFLGVTLILKPDRAELHRY